MVVILPAELERASLLGAKQRPTVQLWYHPRCAWEGRWVEGIVYEQTVRALAERMLPLAKGRSLEAPFTVERRCVRPALMSID